MHPAFRVLQSGVIALGQAVWVRIAHEAGEFGIVSIYAPNSPHERAALWQALKVTLPQDRWIFCGDFNMTEVQEDSMGPSPLIQRREAEFWRFLKVRFDLEDALILKGQVTGSRFTWRRLRIGALVQS